MLRQTTPHLIDNIETLTAATIEGPETTVGQPHSNNMSWQLPVFLGTIGSSKAVANLQLERHTFGRSVAPEDDRTPKAFPADLWGSLPDDTHGRAIWKRRSACLTRDSVSKAL